MDTTKLGEVAASLMESLADNATEHDEIGEVMILAEIHGVDEDGDEGTSIAFRCSDGRLWIQRGLLHAALEHEREIAEDE